MAIKPKTAEVILREAATFNISKEYMAGGGTFTSPFELDNLSWRASLSVTGTKIKIQISSHCSNSQYKGYYSHYYLLLVNADRKEASCAFHGRAKKVHYWEPSESATDPRPTMDAIFKPTGGYVDEENQLTFKVFFEVADVLSAVRWTVPFHRTVSSPILSCNQMPLSTLLTVPRNPLMEAMRELFEASISTDVVIETNGSGDIAAHGIVLMAMSPVFLQFLGDWEKESMVKTICIIDFPGPVVEAFVRYMYYQELEPIVLDEYLADVWGIADKYQVEVLRQRVVELQRSFVTVKNVVDILCRAEVYGAKEIKDFCLGFMVKHIKSIQKQEGALKSLPRNLLADFLVAYQC